MRHNLVDCIPKKNQRRIGQEIKGIFESPDIYFASSRVDEIIAKYHDVYPKFSEKMEEGIEDA